jgi:hypothetical protein
VLSVKAAVSDTAFAGIVNETVNSVLLVKPVTPEIDQFTRYPGLGSAITVTVAPAVTGPLCVSTVPLAPALMVSWCSSAATATFPAGTNAISMARVSKSDAIFLIFILVETS